MLLNLRIQSYSASYSLKKTATRSFETSGINNSDIHRWHPRRPEISFESNLVSVSSILFMIDAGVLRCDISKHLSAFVFGGKAVLSKGHSQPTAQQRCSLTTRNANNVRTRRTVCPASVCVRYWTQCWLEHVMFTFY